MILDPSVPSILPAHASDMAWNVDYLFWFICGTTGITGLGVFIAVIYFCFAYRQTTPEPGATPRILGSHKLELLWSVLPMFLFLVFFGWGAWVYVQALRVPADAPEIFVTGKRWMWKVQYPTGQRVIIGQSSFDYSAAVGGQGRFDGVMVLPVNQSVKITLISEDVIHDFAVPAFRQKIDVLPGRYTHTWYKPTKTGLFDIFCDQYCGTNHSLMVGKVLVVEESEYKEWLNGTWNRPGDNPVDGSLAHQGWILFHKLQCSTCHNLENPKAPNLEGIHGSKRSFAGGYTHTVDDNYIRESIRNPKKKVREGWQAIMPAYSPTDVTEEELIQVIQYIKSLRPGDMRYNTHNQAAPVGAPNDPPSTTGGSK